LLKTVGLRYRKYGTGQGGACLIIPINLVRTQARARIGSLITNTIFQ